MSSNVGNFDEKIPKQRGRCTNCLCMSWKVFTCILSHVTLITCVVAYCVMGSYAFEWLEGQNERDTKSAVKYIRGNLSLKLWKYTEKEYYLNEENWTKHALHKLLDFEKDILNKMKIDGWDGVENPEKQQWTQMGALFYSIIVITTIGYGHIAPKTDAGKISTIFYAIVGIPLMLLCLSNIGDIMASSFRFIYWRVCCFVCTREPKRRPRRGGEFQRSISYHPSTGRPSSLHQTGRPSSLHHPGITRGSNRASMRRSVRVSQRTADSGIDSFYEPRLSHAFSDTDLRYAGDDFATKRNSYRNSRFYRHRNMDRMKQERHTLERERVSERSSSKKYNNVNSDRNRRGHSQRSARAQSVARHEDSKRSARAQSVARYEDPKRSARAHSVARFEDPNHLYHHQSRAAAESNAQNYTMTLPASRGRHRSRVYEKRAKSVDPRIYDSKDDAPVLCNRYAIDAMLRKEGLTAERQNRSKSMPRSQSFRKSLYSPSREASPEPEPEPEPIPKRLHPSERSRYLAPPLPPAGAVPSDDECIELELPDVTPPERRKQRRLIKMPPSPRIMSPMGFAIHRQARTRVVMESFDEEAGCDDDYVDYVTDAPVRPVPIWLCVFLVVSYIIAGAFYFKRTEKWEFLDAAYFCFITLTTIGFGDFVPAQGLNQSALSGSNYENSTFIFDVSDQELKIAGCSLYLLFGISLLAMSFNLVQEEVIANVKNVARQLGILKEEEVEYY